MNRESKDYPVISSLESFWELVQQHGQDLLRELEPSYYARFQTCKKLGLTPDQTHASCDPLLSGRLSRFINMLESLYEVRYYWKRLLETNRLLEVLPPTNAADGISGAQWFTYNLDSYWHAVYGLEERLLAFLTRLKRCYTTTQDSDIRKRIQDYMDIIKQAHTGTKLARDPVAHMRSQGVIGLRDRHDWESSFLVDEKLDLIDIYDNRMLHDKEFYLGYIRQWVPMIGEAIATIFGQLLLFPIDRIR